MARLVYTAIASLDGYVADEQGKFEWAAPDAEVHSFVNDLERPVATHLYGRRMYEVLRFWDTAEAVEGQPSEMRDYAQIWRAADKIVYSRTLTDAPTARTRIERELDPEAVRRMKDSDGGEIAIGGAELAGQALAAGLVDEINLVLVPAVVGGGRPALASGLRVDLELLDERRFTNGTVYLRYAVILPPR